MSDIVTDDFWAGSGSDGAIGSLGWRTGAGTITPQAGTTYHPGIIALTTGSTSGDTCRIHLGRTVSTAIADIGHVLAWQACVALAQTSATIVRVGWGTDISSSTYGTDGVWWSFSSASGSTWKLNTRSGGTTSTVDSGVSGAVEYVVLAARQTGSTWTGWVLQPDGTETVVTSGGHEPASGTLLNAGIYVETSASAAKSLGVDSWGVRYARQVGLRHYLG